MNKPPHTPPRQAVALSYTGQGAPHISAKGDGELATEIINIAKEWDIPLYEDRNLAGMLSSLELGQEIPENLYIAIAQIITFAYMLSGKKPPLNDDQRP